MSQPQDQFIDELDERMDSALAVATDLAERAENLCTIAECLLTRLDRLIERENNV